MGRAAAAESHLRSASLYVHRPGDDVSFLLVICVTYPCWCPRTLRYPEGMGRETFY